MAREFGLAFVGGRARALIPSVLRAAESCAARPRELLDGVLGGQLGMRAELLDRLTIGESYFFREPRQFDWLERYLRRHTGPIRLWSAGCAGGEEAYSLAIAARRALGHEATRVEVLATDLNPRALARAEKGEFRAWSFRGCAREFQERWFDACGGLLRIKDSVRSLVRFRELNLVHTHDWPRAIDVIFCRNVTPYLHHAALLQASETLSQALSVGGFVVCASGDPQLLHGALCRATHDGLRCYRRTAPPLQISSPARPTAPPQEVQPLFAAPARVSGVAPTGIDTQIALDPFNASLYLQRGRLGLEQNRPYAAIRDARRALVADASAAYSHVLIALAALQTRQLSLALRSARLGKCLVEPVSGDALQTFSDDLSRREIHDLLSSIERFGQSTQTSKPWTLKPTAF